MIPMVDVDLPNDFEIAQVPSKTFKLNIDSNKISGYSDNLEAVKQAAYIILNTERYKYLIYSWNYGIELNDLYGKPISFVIPELKRRISEALTQDDRIQSVDAFYFETNRGKVHASFTIHSIYGDFGIERTVNI